MNPITKEQAVKSLERAKATLKSLREEGQRVAKLGVHAGLTVVGGVGAGVLAVKMPKVPGTDIDSDLALGGLLCAVALADVAGDWSDELNAMGAGMLAAGVARETQKALIANP